MEIRDLTAAIEDAVESGFDPYDDGYGGGWEASRRSTEVWVRVGGELVPTASAGYDEDTGRFVIAVPEL